MKQPQTLKIDDIEYVRKDQIKNNEPAETYEGMKYVIVRTYSAGVFAGYLKSRNGQEVVLMKARRIYYWSGAATLSQLAMEGTSKPDECKFPVEMDRVELLNAIEIIDCTAMELAMALTSIEYYNVSKPVANRHTGCKTLSGKSWGQAALNKGSKIKEL